MYCIVEEYFCIIPAGNLLLRRQLSEVRNINDIQISEHEISEGRRLGTLEHNSQCNSSETKHDI